MMPPAPRFWLMKTEPSCFSFADMLKAKERVTSWDGVRNYQARNFLRDEVRVGDGVLIYHSGITEPAIVGMARVVRAGYPDQTALDPQARHFDPRATAENPIWYQVDVQALEPLPEPLSRKALQAHPVLAGMGVLRRANRLSIQPVTDKEWQAVLEVAGLTTRWP